MNITTIHEDIQAQWFSFASVTQIIGKSPRTARTRLSGIDPRLIRYNHGKSDRQGPPEHMYHYSSLPELSAYYRTHVTDPMNEQLVEAKKTGIKEDDLIRAQMRLTCVKEFEARGKAMTKAEAAALTAADWSRNPRSKTMEISERRGRDTRKHTITITLGSVKASTIRTWTKLYARKKRIADLALSTKGKCGCKGIKVSQELLWYVLGNAVDTARADITKAVAYAKKTWIGGDVPDISIRSWQRHIAALDPAKVMAVLGKKGVAAFENECSPDIERDYSQLSYNDLWEIDDVIMDFYVHRRSDPTQLCRPYLYAIMRVPTREWVGYVISEDPITARQVGGLLGHAFTDPAGGLPEHITFERGTVALTDSLAESLDNLEINWHRASMDGGRTWSGAIPDNPKGHSRAKAVLESNNRRLHNILWKMAGQIGIEERHSAPGNTENLKKESIKRVKNNEQPILPHWHDARKFIDTAIAEFNSTPHSGLEKMWDNALGEWRHMSPTEYAGILAEQCKLRIMDSYMLPAFYANARQVPVTKNGIQIGVDRATGQKRWYGRFDDALDTYRGRKVTAYVIDDYPGQCYIEELGATVALYQREAVHGHEQYGKKRHIDKQKRLRFEKTMSDRARYEQEFIETNIKMGAEKLVPDEHITTVTSEQLRQRVATITKAGMIQHAQEQDIATRTAMPTGEKYVVPLSGISAKSEQQPRKRRSLLDLPGTAPVTEETSTDPHEAPELEQPQKREKIA